MMTKFFSSFLNIFSRVAGRIGICKLSVISGFQKTIQMNFEQGVDHATSNGRDRSIPPSHRVNSDELGMHDLFFFCFFADRMHDLFDTSLHLNPNSFTEKLEGSKIFGLGRAG